MARATIFLIDSPDGEGFDVRIVFEPQEIQENSPAHEKARELALSLMDGYANG